MNCKSFLYKGHEGCSITMETTNPWRLLILLSLMFLATSTSAGYLLQCLMVYTLIVGSSVPLVATSAIATINYHGLLSIACCRLMTHARALPAGMVYCCGTDSGHYSNELVFSLLDSSLHTQRCGYNFSLICLLYNVSKYAFTRTHTCGHPL